MLSSLVDMLLGIGNRTIGLLELIVPLPGTHGARPP